MLAARHDDDEIYIYIYIYIKRERETFYGNTLLVTLFLTI